MASGALPWQVILFCSLTSFPIQEIVEERGKEFSHIVSKVIFHMEHHITHIATDNDMCRLQVSKSRPQALFRSRRDEAHKPAEADRLGPHSA